MGKYSGSIYVVKNNLKRKEMLKKRMEELDVECNRLITLITDLENTQKALTTLSDKNTQATLDFITSVVNKTLHEVFKSDTRKVTLKRSLYAGDRAHITVQLTDGNNNTIDMNLQSGTGLKQIVSGLYTICLTEIRKGRRLVIFDERFSGLHKEAKRILAEILKIFAEGGFQFIFVEYGLNSLGKLYNVEKVGDEAKIFSLDGKEYKDEDVFLFSNQPDLTLLDENYEEDFDSIDI